MLTYDMQCLRFIAIYIFFNLQVSTPPRKRILLVPVAQIFLQCKKNILFVYRLDIHRDVHSLNVWGTHIVCIQKTIKESRVNYTLFKIWNLTGQRQSSKLCIFHTTGGVHTNYQMWRHVDASVEFLTLSTLLVNGLVDIFIKIHFNLY